jgi:hypothetical protein
MITVPLTTYYNSSYTNKHDGSVSGRKGSFSAACSSSGSGGIAIGGGNRGANNGVTRPSPSEWGKSVSVKKYFLLSLILL